MTRDSYTSYTLLDAIRTLRASARRTRHHWGAIAGEIRRSLDSDALVEPARLVSTQAITINAPVDSVWPWITQMGYEKRAGFYSYDSLEWLFGARRSREIHVDASAPAVGDEIPFYPGMPLTVAQVDTPHALVFWQLSSHGKALDPTGPRPDDYMLWSWAFVLQEWSPLQTRLVTRMRATYEPRWKWGPYARFVLSPAHWIMGRRGLIGIRDRAEHELDAAMEAPGVQDAGRRRTAQHRRDADERALVR